MHLYIIVLWLSHVVSLHFSVQEMLAKISYIPLYEWLIYISHRGQSKD